MLAGQVGLLNESFGKQEILFRALRERVSQKEKSKEQKRVIEKEMQSKEKGRKVRQRNALDVFDEESVGQEDVNEI